MRRLAFHEALGVLGKGDLHPGGPAVTEALLDELANARPRDVLELGAGLGRTAERMISRGWQVEAVEPSPILRHALQARLGIPTHTDCTHAAAAAEARFDAVIAESVLYAMPLPSALESVRRLLRPGGLLAFVDLVWTDLADPETVARVHDETKRTFGIPMASRERLTWADWKRLLEAGGFACVRECRVEEAAPRAPGQIRASAALRHPLAFARYLHYGYLSRTPRVPSGWLEPWMAVWRAGSR